MVVAAGEATLNARSPAREEAHTDETCSECTGGRLILHEVSAISGVRDAMTTNEPARMWQFSKFALNPRRGVTFAHISCHDECDA
ncbi:hypothetical protein [Demequina litorisediminis]|nr:hypothetical protein [Demequina litorisediminis]